MTTSRKTRFSSKTYKESLDIFHTTSPTSPSLSKSDLNNIQNVIKLMTVVDDKHYSDMKTLNGHISVMLTKLTDTSSKTYKQE